MSSPEYSLIRRFPLKVQVVAYPVIVSSGPDDGRRRTSYEVQERGVTIQRFLWIDHGEKAEAMAACWAEGFVTGLLKGVRS